MSAPEPSLSRRRFLARSAALATGTVVGSRLTPILPAQTNDVGEFRSNWSRCPARVWLGPEFWSNPLQDWRISDGRIECTHAAPDRNVHVLVRALGESGGSFSIRVRMGRVGNGRLRDGQGSAGFRIGIQGPLRDYRNSLVFGQGVDAGIGADGALFIGEVSAARGGAIALDDREVELRLTGAPAADGYVLTLAVFNDRGQELGQVSKAVPRDRCRGNLALVNNFDPPGISGRTGRKTSAAPGAHDPGLGRFWFADWRISGDKVEAFPERAFGPILFSQYTLSEGVMKLTAQMPPLGPQDTPTVRLQLRQGEKWTTAAESHLHPASRTASFRIERWDATKPVPYRVAYELRFADGTREECFWTGTVRRDPVDVGTLKVADISCNIHEAFPNAPFVAHLAKLDPDLLAFTGDQFYENTGGYGAVRAPVDQATLDYLRKWYVHGWTWRELMRDRPVLSLPDDHDVYQGNLWGEAGAGRKTTQAAGGYDMPSEWVNVVCRTQASHHPDPFDPNPGERGTLNYYGALTYGRVSFAVLADRQYKSGPEGKVPNTGGRGDHESNPDFDPRKSDVPGVNLLGARQEEFLRAWVADWRGAEMKAVISQTLFTAFATTHGATRAIVRADYDTNAWPQTPRNRALREIRKGFAFHLAGDQHLPAVVQYGIDEHRDGPVAFAGPAVNVGYPRWWEPARAKWTKPKNDHDLTGDFVDSFGHPMTVLAVKNGAIKPRTGEVAQFLDDKASGLGLVRFDKQRRKITVECWPFLADPTQPGTQFPGWPVEIDMLENYGRKPFGHLPWLEISGAPQPVVHVFDEATGELVYGLRLTSARFRPHVFAAGKYRVRVSEPDAGKSTELRGLVPTSDPRATIAVRI
jgi:alkaline phosphatase D